MHEYAVTESILKIVHEEAGKAGGERVESVTIVIGELSTFVDQSIEFYFQALSQGTVAEGARLIFEKVKARAVCGDCGKEFEPSRVCLTCPRCHSPLFEVKQGRELYIDNLEIH